MLELLGLVRGGENRLVGVRGNTSLLAFSGSCFGEVSAGEEEEEEELTELSEDRLRREEMEEMGEMGEKADFSLVCWRSWAWWASRAG